jgi:hypothetical protein
MQWISPFLGGWPAQYARWARAVHALSIPNAPWPGLFWMTSVDEFGMCWLTSNALPSGVILGAQVNEGQNMRTVSGLRVGL